MATSGADPHRVLGVAQGATIEEIRRAYRALAKRHHPDAGQGSVARFLEIQAAYEALTGTAAPGGERRPRREPAEARPTGRRPADGGPAGRPGRRPAQGAEPSRGPGTNSGTAAGGGAGAGWARRPAREGARRAPGTPPGGPAGAPAGRAPRPRDGSRRHPPDPAGGRGSGRRATLGSTTYDEAEEVFEPGWSGASWYGPTSGTYWTLNPKEYADPRKHGPEYQARGRGTPSAAGGAGAGGSVAGPATCRTEGNGAAAEAADAAGATGEARAATGAARAAAGARDGGLPPAWRATWTAGRPPDEPAPPFDHGPASPAAPRPAPDPGEAPRFGAADAGGEAVAGVPAGARSDPGSPGPLPRLVLAAVGWLPVGLALGAAAGLPGGLLATLPLQVLGLVLLTFQPRVAWAAAGGATAVAFAAIPVTAVVAALGGGVTPGGPAPLVAVALALVAWLAGAVAAASGRLLAYPWEPER